MSNPQTHDYDEGRPCQEGDEGVIVKPGGGHGFPIGEPVRMIGYTPLGSERWRSLRTGDHWAVPPHCVKPREAPSGKAVPKSTPAREAGWDVGDQGTVVDGDGDAFVEAGDRVELVEDDGTTLPFFRNLSRVTGYGSIALFLGRVRVDSPEEAPAIPASATNDPTAWQVGDRFEVVDSRCNPFETGEVVELVMHDYRAQWRRSWFGYAIHDFRSVHTGKTGAAKSHRLKRLDPQAPTPAPGDVWDVVTPNLPPGQVSRLYVESLTDRVVTLRLTDWKPIPERWAPRLGSGPMRYERSSVRFVERVQD